MDFRIQDMDEHQTVGVFAWSTIPSNKGHIYAEIAALLLLCWNFGTDNHNGHVS